jgi:regulator of ribonuclease activity A
MMKAARVGEKQPPIVTADLYDMYPRQVQVCELQFRSFGKIDWFYGTCSTLKTFEDHTPVLKALQQKGRGRILVVDGGGSLRVGIMGDKLAETGTKNGWAGVVIAGAIRDSVGIDALNIGVKALGATARRGWQTTQGLHDVSLQFGSASFEPGYWVYADRDCVIVSKQKLKLSNAAP